MRKIMVMVLGFAMTCGLAYAAVVTGTFGDQDTNKRYRMQVDSDGVIYMPPTTILGIGTTAPAGLLDLGGYTRSYTSSATTSFGVAGDIETDRNLYAGTGTISNLTTTGTGQIFAGGAVEIDGALYADASIYFGGSVMKAATGYRFLCINTLGLVVSTASTCGAGT